MMNVNSNYRTECLQSRKSCKFQGTRYSTLNMEYLQRLLKWPPHFRSKTMSKCIEQLRAAMTERHNLEATLQILCPPNSL